MVAIGGGIACIVNVMIARRFIRVILPIGFAFLDLDPWSANWNPASNGLLSGAVLLCRAW